MRSRLRKSTDNKNEKSVKVTQGNCLGSYLDFSNFRLNADDLSKVSKNIANLAANYIFRLHCNNKDKYMAVIMVYGVDVLHYSNADKRSAFSSFGYATKLLDLPHKYVFSHKKPDLSKQKEFLEYKKNKADHPFTKAMLNQKLKQIDDLEQNHHSNLAYLFVYSDNADVLYSAADQYCNALTDTSAMLCNFTSTISFLRSLMNFSDCDANAEPDYTRLNEHILPDTLTVGQDHFKVDNTYVTSIVVKDYPAALSPLTITGLTAQKYLDIVATWDVCTISNEIVKAQLSASMNELSSRWIIKQNVAENIDTQTEFAKIEEIYNAVTNGAENVVYTTLRFYIYSDSLDRLRNRAAAVRKDLEANSGLLSYIPENQMFTEYLRLVSEANNIQTPMPLYDTYSKQFPFYFQEHIDETGMFLGYTQTDGLAFINTFLRNRFRSSYDMLLIGVKGGGKTVTLKSMLQDQLLLNNKVMTLDLENEYSDLVKMYDGQSITMNRQAFINPLQIKNTIDYSRENISDDESEADKMTFEDAAENNFVSEISRICTFMYQYVPTMTYDVMSLFRDILVEAYADKGITQTTDVTRLKAENFPIFSDLLLKINRKLTASLSDSERQLYKTLQMYVRELTKAGAYGSMFDSYTNVEINNNNLIVFNVKALSEMDENVYNAQLFNILSLMWSEICKNVRHNNNLVNPYDRRNVVCLIDEAHRFISTKNTLCTDFILKLVRRTRKYDAALWFATQSILDFMPSDSGESADTVKKIFQLVQYKILLKQSSDSVELLHSVFNQFTTSELYATDSFVPGEMLLSLGSGKNKIHCRKAVTSCDLMYIGNSQDRDEIIDNIFNSMYLMNWNPQELIRIMYQSEEKTQEFIQTFTGEVMDYFGFKRSDSEYLYATVNRIVKNLAKRFGDKYITEGV